MNQPTDNLTLQMDTQLVIEQTVQRLVRAGLQVMRSFDLQATRAAQFGCTCPYHGTDLCDCQMVVLLIYGQDGSPVTLVVHGHDGQTQIGMVDAPDQHPVFQMVNMVLETLLITGERGRKVPDIRLEEGYTEDW